MRVRWGTGTTRTRELVQIPHLAERMERVLFQKHSVFGVMREEDRHLSVTGQKIWTPIAERKNPLAYALPSAGDESQRDVRNRFASQRLEDRVGARS